MYTLRREYTTVISSPRGWFRDSWALIDWESARPHGVRISDCKCDIRTPDYSGIYTGAKGDVYSAAMSIVVARNQDHPENLDLEVHELTDGIFCSAYMYGKNWESELRPTY